jgi:hypothetical protein
VIGTHSTRPRDAAITATSDSMISSLLMDIESGW